MKKPKYEYMHSLPENTVYAFRPGSRLRRDEHYRLAQSKLALHKLTPYKTYERRVNAFLPPSGKSITLLGRLQAIEKLQKKSVEIQKKRAKEEKDFSMHNISARRTEGTIEQQRALREKTSPALAKLSSSCKAAAKRKFKVYPSAYANMWASKTQKAGKC